MGGARARRVPGIPEAYRGLNGAMLLVLPGLPCVYHLDYQALSDRGSANEHLCRWAMQDIQ
jgi:hypothetical protein